jgi:hypothetical protein
MISDKQYDAVHDFIEERNSRYDVWGWKQPNEFKTFFTHILDKVRNPIFFVIVRDVVAIANRNHISALTDITSSIFSNLHLYEMLLTKVFTSGHPCLLISYEKALLDPDTFLRRLAEFASSPTPAQMAAACAFVQPSPSDYLELARVTDAKGAVNKVESRRISGWAFFPKRPSSPVRVNLFVNDRLISNTEAILHRKDLLEKKLHPSGNCGFKFLLDEAQKLVEGDKVQIRAVGDTKFLGRGTYIFQVSNEPK